MRDAKMARVCLKWLGRAAFIITSSEGKTIIIDPWIVDNPQCPIKVDDIEAADIVLVTHDHSDHTGSAVDIVKKTGAILVAMVETARRFQSELGLPAHNVIYDGRGMNIGASARIAGITITMTQAFHSSRTASAAGYIIKLEDGATVYHAGDTGIFESMRLLAEMYPLDVALLPIGSVYTMDPVQAAWATKLLKPKIVIPMHYKGLPVLEQDTGRFVQLVKKEAPGVEVVVLEPGQEYWMK
jgi:L-ascorbate metabolism protein UlaG (beta-lactamase superfamily)